MPWDGGHRASVGGRWESPVLSPSLPPSTPAGIGLSRKKRVYVKLLPPAAAATAVFDLKLSSRSKALPHYMKIG